MKLTKCATSTAVATQTVARVSETIGIDKANALI